MHTTTNSPYVGYGWTHLANPTTSDYVDPMICGGDICCIFG